MSLATILLACDVLATGMIAGFLAMYCLTIGRYFTFMVRTGQADVLQRTYSEFRRRTRLKPVYDLIMLLQLLIALVALVACWSTGSLSLIPAVCCLPFLLLVHGLTGFTRPEERLASGQSLTDAELSRYLRLNIPLHVIYACVYATAMLALLIPRLP